MTSDPWLGIASGGIRLESQTRWNPSSVYKSKPETPIIPGVCSLHDKASKVKPNLGTKPSTIIVAVLKVGTNADGDPSEEDFLWIKCSMKLKLVTIYEQYDIKRTIKTPWVLKYGGEPANLDHTVGSFNNFNGNLVVFEAVETLPKQALGAPQPSTDTRNLLSPKDPNPRLRPSYIAPKPVVSGKDENAPQPHLHSFGQQSRYAPSPMALPPASLSRSSSCTPQQGNGHLPGTASQHQPSASPAPPIPLVKVEIGKFPEYRDTWIDWYRKNYPGLTHDELERTIWSHWLQLPPSARSTPSSTSVKTERTSSDRAVFSPPRTTPESAGSVGKVDAEGQNYFQLSAMLKDATPQLLESAVEASVKLLDTLRAPLADKLAGSPDAEHWIQAIENLKKQAVKTKTVIGVVGNTGAGKSSVINAMLDEERLVPTNCMRACTAVVTEISYNLEEIPYCAEIEFITLEDWRKELKILFQDLLDDNGNVSRECTNEDSEAGVAYAKIKAVYPQKTKEDIANSSIDTMMKDVSHILGTSRNIKETDSLMFYKKLQSFVDSKEKSTGKKDKDGKKQKKEREFWPLIRVVRLYVKSPALATGAVIVDLPGVHDANAARAAVAEGYMKQCTGLWIVAPINRAVDDKAAKSLLGESFKRQLKMDGGFSAVTFICSKTDDISISEAQESLGLDDKMVPSYEELDRLSAKQKELKKKVTELNETKAVYTEVAEDADDQFEVWETLERSVRDGNVTYPPKVKSGGKKRKAPGKEKSSSKKRKINLEEGDSDFIDDSNGSDVDQESEEESDNDSEDQQPLTEEDVTAKLKELRTTKKDAKRQRDEISQQVQEIRKELKAIEEAESKLNSEMSALCIAGRNQYSKGAIQQDFAAGIKEIDQEIAAEEDEDNFNPEVEVRDYDEVAKSLPVFCVSSRGYQKLRGRHRKDPYVAGFTNIEETEIPALQAHCEKLTETGREANCRAFINKMNSLLNSLTLWASSDGTGANLSPEQKDREARFLQKGMDGLESRLEKAAKTCARELHDELQDAIFDRYEAAVQAAAGDSIQIAAKWGWPVNRENRAAGGLFWSSYKAVCRRNGVFTNGQGLHDWNAQLTEPMIKLLAPGWEKVFTRRVQSVLNNFTKAAPTILKKFHRDMEDRARKIGTDLSSLSMLSHQITTYEQIFKDVAAGERDAIMTLQKDINREFTPVIERNMTPSYEGCTAECGPGSYKRMKTLMNEHVEQSRHRMFQESADEVRRQLDTMVHDVGERLADKTDEVFIQIKRDYRAVLGGGNIAQGEVIPRLQRQVRKETKKTIDGVEKMMKKVMGLEVDESADVKAEEDDALSELDDDSETKSKIKSEDNDARASGSDEDKSEHVDQPTQPSSPDAEISDEESDEGDGGDESDE
ncbi:MAG: hypothetical protein Q9207_006271 [Kuettlingeria erythrocarpa]